MVQKTLSKYFAVVYFVPIVFCGAFFLLNLTLAVINSKFTEAHNAHEAQLTKGPNLEEEAGHSDDELEAKLADKDEMSIS